ncbi:MAG: hypothetical protein JW720_06870 [Sedimentisphaerales bacterium]|nr:hypothetical protein [Sedimentisphaerales bacterium]
MSQNQSHQTWRRKKWTCKRLAKIGLIIGILAGIATILTWVGIIPGCESKTPTNNNEGISSGDVNGNVVTSQNQSGGITAGGDVYVNQQRAISPEPKFKRTTMGDKHILRIELDQTPGIWDSSSTFQLSVKVSGPYETAKITQGFGITKPGITMMNLRDLFITESKEEGLYSFSTTTPPREGMPIVLEIQSVTELDLLSLDVEPK